MKKKTFSILIVLLLLFITPVHAKDINHFYTDANQKVKFEDKVNGDSAIAGEAVDILGNIDGIGFIAGKEVNVKGTIEYGFVAGSDVSINGTVNKNLYAAGKTITITNDANIKRDSFMAAEKIVIEGTINRDVTLGASELIIKESSTIEGDLKTAADQITIEDGATIKGTFKYNKDAKTNIGKEANINKTKTYSQNENTKSTPVYETLLISIFNMIVVFVVFKTFMPKTTSKYTEMYTDTQKYINNLGTGIIMLIVIPLLTIFLLVSSIGMYLGLILLALYFICIYLAYIISGMILGDLIFNKLLKHNINSYFSGIIGIVILEVLMTIPYIGGIITVAAITLGLGTIYKTIVIEEHKKEKKENNKQVIEAELIKKNTKKKN